MIATDLRLAPLEAAFVNSLMAASASRTDMHPASTSHPGAVIFPVALACAALKPANGRDFLRAVIVGYEAMGRLGRIVVGERFKKTFRSTSVIGTIGGALKMNAGCYGREIEDIFVEATALDSRGIKIKLTPADMNFVYRKTQVRDELIFLEAVFEGHVDTPEAIKARMKELSANREAAQPIKSRTGGSTFKNPPGHKAWKLVDEAGCRGLRRGDAQVSEKHTNFLINVGDATAADLEALGEDVRKRVKENSGIELEWEIKRVGIAGEKL